MFGLFSRKQNNDCPIDIEMRLWMENAFLWLAGQFGDENILSKKILLPNPEDFPIIYNGSEESLIQTAEIVAKQMEIDFAEINISVYKENIQEISGDLGYRVWTEVDKTSEGLSAGLYLEKGDDGKYQILIEKTNLTMPENLVATIAHEFSHIKLLGEKRVDFNDEFLTDLTPVVFGLGIFNANSAFRFYQNFESWGHNTLGYMKQKEWAYALALYAFYRQETNPEWTKHLTTEIKSEFKKSMQYITLNKEKIFMEEYKNGSS